ncbi:MAG TPA: S41 family peptidase [Bryobacteraceae bacterium]|nr:S41 family peptidase [Bryobacteraceae bacterium]
MKTISLLFVSALFTSGQPAPSPDFPIDAATRSRVVMKAADNVERYYYNEALGKQMAASLRTKQAAGGYDRLNSGHTLASELQADLRAVSRDGHLAVFASAIPLPTFDLNQPPPPPTAEQIQQHKALMQKVNGFVTDAVWLPGNVGYLSLDAFADPDVMKQQLAHAMNLLANTDAMIIDMRTNKGGSPSGVAALASYFFDEAPVHLNDILSPRDNGKVEFWTERELPGARYGTSRPVYVLTAKATFSAAEELAYDLQALKRATVVGEQTGGGANPAGGVPIDQNFGMAIPRSTARNPYTGMNWEGVGVTPDVKVDAMSAKDAAYLMALLQLRERSMLPPFVRDQIQNAITRLLSKLGTNALSAVQEAQAARR